MNIYGIPGADIILKHVGLNEDFALPQFTYHQLPSDPLTRQSTLFTAFQQRRPLFLGNRSHTYDLIKTFTHANKDAGLIIFDAHPHCKTNDYLRMLIDEGVILSDHVLLIGTRVYTAEEAAFLRTKGVRCINLNQIIEETIAESAFSIMEIVREWPSAFLSISIDVVDPVFAPGTLNPAVGGLTARELLFFIQKLKLVKNIKAVELVGIAPEKDVNNLTLQLGATLVAALY